MSAGQTNGIGYDGVRSPPDFDSASPPVQIRVPILLPFEWISLCLIALILTGCNSREPDRSHERTPRQAGTETDFLMIAFEAFNRNKIDAAEAAIRNHLLKDPLDARGLELAGDIALRRGDSERTTEMYWAAVDQSASPTESSLDKLAQQLMRVGLAFDSIDVLARRVEHFPGSAQARYDFVGLVTVLGLPQRSVPSLRWLAQRQHGDAESLQVLADPRRVEPDEELCRRLLMRNQDDLRAVFGLAVLEAKRIDWTKVAQLLEPVLDQHPDFVPAYTLYGRALAELGNFEQLPLWQQRAPSEAASAPDYWLVAGQWAEDQRKHDEAARAYWEATRIDPAGYPEVLPNLWRSLSQLGRESEADFVSELITKHATLRDALKTHFERNAQSQAAALEIADALMLLGRVWEAEGWARLAASLPEDRVDDLRARYRAIRSKLAVDTPWQTAEMSIVTQIDLEDLPSVKWVASAPRNSPKTPSSRAVIQFADQAEQRGWIHTCEVAPETATEGHSIYQTVGGGVGVIDFDLDGWPDLAAAMLNGKPQQENSSPNQLYRNLNGRFDRCTDAAHYLDRGFSQGIAVGDFNDDGFPDIFDANIGGNRLFRNNGDGTFREVSAEVGLSGDVWTTSAIIADINGDGFADLYEVGYCGGDEPYKVFCRNKRGQLSTCPPLTFEAERDRIWRGAADGTFVDATDQWMEQSSAGRGLGVVIGMFDEIPGLDLLVANDMTVNHFWSGSRRDGEEFRLTDLGAVRGVGFSGRSLSQASMGMAVGDADRDGDIDFFLTHFSDDHNTYYEQVASGLWVDRSFQVGLSDPSMNLLGFGTEWIDFDNNGTLELIVANGHIDDVDRTDIAYQMPAQVFERRNSGRWVELGRQHLGDYFSANHLGRALVNLDADRDGRADVAVTHLYEPVALLMNRTEDVGTSISFTLTSTSGHRDAIGATVTVSIGDQTVSAQLTSGGGYMCSNQRHVTFGTGLVDEVRDVKVKWSAGESETFGTVVSGRDYVLVEGAGKAFLLDGKR